MIFGAKVGSQDRLLRWRNSKFSFECWDWIGMGWDVSRDFLQIRT